MPEREAIANLLSLLQVVAALKGEREAQRPIQGDEEPPREGREHRPWDRQPGEDRKHFRWFLAYRDVGPGRTIRKAMGDARNMRGTCGPAWADMPKRAQEGILSYRRTLAARNHWRDRAHAWDDWQTELAQRKVDAKAIEAADREAEEIIAERVRQIEAGRNAVEAGTAVVRRFMRLVEQGALDKMTLERVKLIVEGEQKGSRLEKETKAVTEHLQAALTAIIEGQRIQRIAQEQVTEKRQVMVDLGNIDRLADIIIAKVPESEREAVLAEIARVLRGEGVAERE